MGLSDIWEWMRIMRYVGIPSNKLQPLLNGPRTYDIVDFERDLSISISSEILICYSHYLENIATNK